jgi:hypothetical protein
VSIAPARNSKVRQALNRMTAIGVVLLGMLGFAATPAIAATTGPTAFVKTSANDSFLSPPRMAWKWDEVAVYLNRSQSQAFNSGGMAALTGVPNMGYLASIPVAIGTDKLQGKWQPNWCYVLHVSWMHPSWTWVYTC